MWFLVVFLVEDPLQLTCPRKDHTLSCNYYSWALQGMQSTLIQKYCTTDKHAQKPCMDV